jgi:hypothetical protein
MLIFVIKYQVYQLKMLMVVWIYYFLVLKERSSSITGISSMYTCFILKSMVRVERPIIVEFVLRDKLLMSLKLIIIGS